MSKRRVDRYGRETGGRPLAHGALYHMLQNRLYRGEIAHKENNYLRAHNTIIDEQLWASVQQTLAARRQERMAGTNSADPSLLAGYLEDGAGKAMTPTHANKKRPSLLLLRLAEIQAMARAGRRSGAPHRQLYCPVSRIEI